MASRGNDVTGIDISKIAVETATARLKDSDDHGRLTVRFQCGDARNLDFEENTFDFVVSHDLVEHISQDDFKRHLAEIERVLKPGGHYLFWTPSRLRGGSSLGLHLIEYTIRDLDRILKETNFEYEWIDLRLYVLQIRFSIPERWLSPVIGYETVLQKIIGAMPAVLRKFLVPPILMSLEKPI